MDDLSIQPVDAGPKVMKAEVPVYDEPCGQDNKAVVVEQKFVTMMTRGKKKAHLLALCIAQITISLFSNASAVMD